MPRVQQQPSLVRPTQVLLLANELPQREMVLVFFKKKITGQRAASAHTQGLDFLRTHSVQREHIRTHRQRGLISCLKHLRDQTWKERANV